MKATIDVPDGLYRRVKARSALEGRSVRDVTVLLFERWLDESPGLAEALADAGRPSAGTSWLKRWDAIGARVDAAATDDRTTRDILVADRK
ncbi:MAG: hypothetical protein ACJ777_04265 [Chloroflexota bacterium]|jgi:hypothetical protein